MSYGAHRYAQSIPRAVTKRNFAQTLRWFFEEFLFGDLNPDPEPIRINISRDV